MRKLKPGTTPELGDSNQTWDHAQIWRYDQLMSIMFARMLLQVHRKLQVHHASGTCCNAFLGRGMLGLHKVTVNRTRI